MQKIKNHLINYIEIIQSFKFYKFLFKGRIKNVVIQQIKTADENTIYKKYKRPSILRTNRDITYKKFIAKNGKMILGSIILAFNKKEQQYWIYDLFVKLKHRGIGVGEKLLLSAINSIDDPEAKVLNLRVNKDKLPAISLYEKYNFTEYKPKETMQNQNNQYKYMKKAL